MRVVKVADRGTSSDVVDRRQETRVLYVVNNAAFFASHRLPVALAARAGGAQVALLTGLAGSASLEGSAVRMLRDHGITHFVVNIPASGINPITELWGLCAVIWHMRRWRPTIIHCASPKGLLHGGLAARVAGVRGVVFALSGMGFVYTAGASRRRRLLRVVYESLLRKALAHANKRVIVQNRDDRAWVIDAGLARESEVVLIPGSGVSLAPYLDLPCEPREDLVVLPARLLKDKGVVEFVEAARSLRKERPNWRFALVGTADYRNPSAVAEDQVRAWANEGVIEWWGHCDDMPSVLRRARIVCLPSYREGMPKALLEAAAAGCAVVTTDTIGCREAIVPGQTGDLVPVGDAAALAVTLRGLIDDPVRRRQYALAGRRLAAERFDIEAVIASTLKQYDEVESGCDERG
jgi:glycosyltransferase involved in cell wall biosynthesis